MYQEWKTGLAGQPVDGETGDSVAREAALAARRAASDLLDESEEMARDMASASFKRGSAAQAGS